MCNEIYLTNICRHAVMSAGYLFVEASNSYTQFAEGREGASERVREREKGGEGESERERLRTCKKRKKG